MVVYLDKRIFILCLLCNNVLAANLNFLFIIADDLRPSLGCYQEKSGKLKFYTPNLDKLAANSVIFTNAFAQQAICGASRTSFLTGRRPDTLRTFDNHHAYWREFVGNFTTIPQYFKQNGYFTATFGKVFHPGKLSNFTDDWPISWSQKPYHPSSQKYKNAKVCASSDGKLHANIVCPVNVSLQQERTLPDIQTVKSAVNFLKQYKNRSHKKPLFLAVGFHKPHIPLKYPKEFKDLYHLFDIDVANNSNVPEDLPDVAWNPWQDLRIRWDIKNLNTSFPYGPIPFYYQKLVKQSYYSSVSYIDFLVGQLMLGLVSSGFEKNTVIIFTSDHGWSLGEHGEWSKYSNFAEALRVPLLLCYPNQPIKGQINNFIELVDLFPTFADIAGLRVPSICPEDSRKIKTCVEGRSFMNSLKNTSAKSKSAIFAQYPRPSLLPQLNSDQPRFKDIKYMGYTMRTDNYQYTEWIEFDAKTNLKNWTKVKARELYNLRNDFGQNNNVESDHKYAKVVHRLSKQLHKGWKYSIE